VPAGAQAYFARYQAAALSLGGLIVCGAAYAAGLSTIRLPSSSTGSPVLRAYATTDGCQSTLPASGPPMIAIGSDTAR
jgi:hypothetical protein